MEEGFPTISHSFLLLCLMFRFQIISTVNTHLAQHLSLSVSPILFLCLSSLSFKSTSLSFLLFHVHGLNENGVAYSTSLFLAAGIQAESLIFAQHQTCKFENGEMRSSAEDVDLPGRHSDSAAPSFLAQKTTHSPQAYAASKAYH